MVIMNKGRFEYLEKMRIANNLSQAIRDSTFKTRRPGAWEDAVSSYRMDAQTELHMRLGLYNRDAGKINHLKEQCQEAINNGDIVSPEPPEILGEVVENAKRLEVSLIKHLQEHYEDIQKIPWDVLEHLVGEFYKKEGWTDVRLVGRDPSTGADLFVSSGEHLEKPLRFFIEVKQHKTKAGIEIIHQVAGVLFLEREKHEWQHAVIVVPVGFQNIRNYNKNDLKIRGIDLRDKQNLIQSLEGYKPLKNGLWLPDPLSKMPIPKKE
jgi:hypothetical protein